MHNPTAKYSSHNCDRILLNQVPMLVAHLIISNMDNHARYTKLKLPKTQGQWVILRDPASLLAPSWYCTDAYSALVLPKPRGFKVDM